MPSRLSSLTLSHFRSHRRAVLAPSPGFTAIHGPNGAGKTNLIEAVSLLSPGRGLRRATMDEIARRPETVGWRVTAELEGPGARHMVDLRAAPGQPRSTRIDGRAVAQTALGRIVRVLWLVPAMDRLWTEAAEGRRRFLDRLAMSFDPAHAEAALAYDKALRERNRLLRDGVHDPRWFDALEARMAQAGAAIAAGRSAALARVAAALAAAGPAFPVPDLAVGGPHGAGLEDAGALRAALAAGRGQDARAGRSLTGPHRADLDAVYGAKDMPAAACSTGEQKALLISVVLANARALAADLGTPPVLLLDEVAAHLDPDRRAALYAEIAAIGAQAFLTGTDAALFADLPGAARHWRVEERDGESQVTPSPC